MIKKSTCVLLLSCFVMLMACADEKKVKVINPNGDSELALLMREMYEDGQRIKKQIVNGEQPEIITRFKEIHTADATEPEKVNTDAYRMYADAYLNALNMLENSNEDDIHVNYGAMVQSCINCHQVLCPGPIVRIKKLELPELF